MVLVVTVLGSLFAVGFLVTAIRATLFAYRHKDQLGDLSLTEKSSWFLMLFKANSFGAELEKQRKNHALLLMIFGGLFFTIGGLVQFLVPAG